MRSGEADCDYSILISERYEVDLAVAYLFLEGSYGTDFVGGGMLDWQEKSQHCQIFPVHEQIRSTKKHRKPSSMKSDVYSTTDLTSAVPCECHTASYMRSLSRKEVTKDSY